MDKLLRWKRGTDGYLFLQVLQNNNWVSYTQATYRKPDTQIPGIRNSLGFPTAQEYLRQGYKYIKFEENYGD